jgi:hypothetical protein
MHILQKITRPVVIIFFAALFAAAQDSQPTKTVGAVTAVQGNVISLKTDAGAVITVTVADGTHILRTAPGQTDLKTATPVPLTELQIGDRVLARGKASDDGKTIAANTVVVMKQSDVAAKQQKEKEDWQRRGTGGLVKAVNAMAGTVTLATTGLSTQSVTVQTAKDTVVREYAPESVKFDDAKLSSLKEVKPGDQLRARGSRSPDGATITAEEIVFGRFRNVAGTISSIDTANQTMTVMDLATKKPVVVKITPESQMHKLPQMVATAIAFRMRGGSLPGESGGGAQQRPQGAPPAPAPQGAPAGGARQGGPGGPGGMRNADLSQMLARMPQVALTDLQKGDALMLVTTQGDGSTVSAVTLLAGVEPILAAPNPLQASTILSPWNIGAGGGADAQ